MSWKSLGCLPEIVKVLKSSIRESKERLKKEGCVEIKKQAGEESEIDYFCYVIWFRWNFSQNSVLI